MMKFTVNHQYKFQNYRIAWTAGFLQVVSCLFVEVVSIGVICAAVDTIDVIFNFISLEVVVEFDLFVFYSIKNESFKELIERPFVKVVTRIKHTTSKKCKEIEKSDEVNE